MVYGQQVCGLYDKNLVLVSYNNLDDFLYKSARFSIFAVIIIKKQK